MGHPDIDNQTSFEFEPLILSDEDGRQLLVPVVKATFEVGDDGVLRAAEEQNPVNLAGEPWGAPETSSYKYEPETAFFKPSTDVVLIGHAHAPRTKTTELLASMVVGPIKKTVRVVGDRFWHKTAFGISMTNSEPFEKIPLIYERAFGGWDRRHPDETKHTFEARNPVGTGFRTKGGKFEEGIRLPNLEDPRQPLKKHGETPVPFGFGFISPNWQPRAALAGTYDAAWSKNRQPLLPKDFDRQFFNAAPPDQIAPEYLRGDEQVQLVNVTPEGRRAFQLPGIPPPTINVILQYKNPQELTTSLDTVILNTDENLVLMIWRAHIALDGGMETVSSITVAQPEVG